MINAVFLTFFSKFLGFVSPVLGKKKKKKEERLQQAENNGSLKSVLQVWIRSSLTTVWQLIPNFFKWK